MKLNYRLCALSLWLCTTLFNAQADVMTVEDLLAELSAGKPGTRIAYGDDPLQFGELHVPGGDGPFPVVVFIHGGCRLAEYDITTTRPLAWALRDEGIAVWNLEYRRVGNPGGTNPGLLLDIGSGIDYVRTLAAEYPLNIPWSKNAQQQGLIKKSGRYDNGQVFPLAPLPVRLGLVHAFVPLAARLIPFGQAS